MKRTGFAAIHERLGAKMIPFAGFLMPIQYASITQEHQAVRRSVGIFDISHMGEFVFEGPRAAEAVERVTVNHVGSLAVHQAQYSAMVDESGGIIDDCVVYRLAESKYMMVVNASNIDKNWPHVCAHLPEDGVRATDISDETSLLAVQGPRAEELVTAVTRATLKDIGFYWKMDGEIAGVKTIISRTGYTGEDGFELYFSREKSEPVWETIESAGQDLGLQPCGLGARDTLRLEMKYALYGNDIDQTTNPYEAGLGWIVKLEKGEFFGSEALQKIAQEGPARRLIGFRVIERGIPRPRYPVVIDGKTVAGVCSGAMSPSLGYGIGTCYLPREHTKAGTRLGIMIRGRKLDAEVVKTPFYTHGSLKR